MNQIEELQLKLAFQENTIEDLNQALIAQQKQIADLDFKMQHVMEKIKTLSVSNIASQSDEEPPPHY